MSGNCFVATISLEKAEKLREDLLSQGFSLSQPVHTLFSAQKSGVSCTLYLSGKLTVQGKKKEEFITFYLEPEILESLAYSHPTAQASCDMTPHIGSDESGKGDFFGPLCIASVQADGTMIENLLKIGVQDSKKMSDPAILAMEKKIRAVAPHSIVRISPKRYNEMYEQFQNLNQLLAWAHATAIGELVAQTGCKEVLLDQFASQDLVGRMLKKKGIDVTLTQRPRAEEDPVVAAASILARASFVSGLANLSTQFNVTLPKGASSQVIRIGKNLVAARGKDVLYEVSKVHFKTTGAILET